MPAQTLTDDLVEIAEQFREDVLTFDPATQPPPFEVRPRPLPKPALAWPAGLAPVGTGQGPGAADILVSIQSEVDALAWRDIFGVEPHASTIVTVGDVSIATRFDLASTDLWDEALASKPKLAVAAGTAGAVKADTVLGSVVIANQVVAPGDTGYTGSLVKTGLDAHIFSEAFRMAYDNFDKLPSVQPMTFHTNATTIDTAQFAFDDAADRFGYHVLDPQARAVCYGDSIMAKSAAAAKIPWLSVRAVSHPQMDDPSIEQESKIAAGIHARYGQITGWNAALAVWAIAAKLSLVI